MTLFKIAILVFIAISFKFTDGKIVERWIHDEIPERCIKNSKTRVTCQYLYKDDGMRPHPDDCQLFYYCVAPGAEPVCRQCPSQLHFNPTLHVCDFPAEAGCYARIK